MRSVARPVVRRWKETLRQSKHDQVLRVVGKPVQGLEGQFLDRIQVLRIKSWSQDRVCEQGEGVRQTVSHQRGCQQRVEGIGGGASFAPERVERIAPGAAVARAGATQDQLAQQRGGTLLFRRVARGADRHEPAESDGGHARNPLDRDAQPVGEGFRVDGTHAGILP